MTILGGRVSALGAGAFVILAACEEGQFIQPAPNIGASEGQVAQAARTEIRDVDRGDIFSTTELALWDGRPSLGGIWVAHPDVADPERVRIENTTNGQSISGALFRRERQNPGPRVQVSSDAAAALGILAGQPTEVSIIVVRQEEVVIQPAVLAEPDTETADDDEENVPEGASNDEDQTSAATATAAAAVATAEVASDSKPGFWQRFRESLRNKPEADDAPMAADGIDTANSAASPDVETAPLDPIAAAAAAIDEAEAKPLSDVAPAPARPIRQAAATTAPAAAPAPAAPANTGLKNPYIQVGLFSVEANANAAASSLRQGGIVPTIAPGSNADREFWRVLVGPMATPDDQAAMLAQVRALGYSDAFLSPN